MDVERAVFPEDQRELSVVSRVELPIRKVRHPLLCRLDETASIDITSPISMTEVGFSCLAVGMLTAFRPLFLILVCIIPRIRPVTNELRRFKELALPVCYIWFSIVMFVLFLTGIIPIFAEKIRKRWILLIHPWAMLVMYADVIVWLFICTSLYINLEMVPPFEKNVIKNVTYPRVFIILLSIDIITYFLMHYILFTLYIAAELTLIEKFY